MDNAFMAGALDPEGSNSSALRESSSRPTPGGPVEQYPLPEPAVGARSRSKPTRLSRPEEDYAQRPMAHEVYPGHMVDDF